MATIPDTPDLADAADQLGATAAAARLRLLHRLGATEEGVAAGLRAERDALAAQVADLTAERDTLASERDTLAARVAALEAQVAALAPATDGGVPVGEFRKRLIPLRIALALHPDDRLRAKWGAVLPELGHFTTVYPRQQPVSALVAMAVADRLLSQADADALAAPAGG